MSIFILFLNRLTTKSERQHLELQPEAQTMSSKHSAIFLKKRCPNKLC